MAYVAEPFGILRYKPVDVFVKVLWRRQVSLPLARNLGPDATGQMARAQGSCPTKLAGNNFLIFLARMELICYNYRLNRFEDNDLLIKDKEVKEKIHPKYFDTTVSCACGNVIKTRSTVKDLKVEICSNCHPFFTGRQKLVDTAGRIERYRRKYGMDKEKKGETKPAAAQKPKSA